VVGQKAACLSRKVSPVFLEWFLLDPQPLGL